MTHLLEVRDVSVRFGRVPVLRDVSFAVDPGTVVGLIGPNGAGKTTLLDVVSGFVEPASGDVLVDGTGLRHEPAHTRAGLGVARTFQSLELFDELTVADNLRVAREGAGVAAPDVDDVVRRLGLDPDDHRAAAELSRGERSSLALVRALAARPRLLLLDEPAAGLDADGRRRLADVVRDVAATGTGVVLVDHDLALVLEVCDRVVVLDLGAVVADAPPADIRADPKLASVYLGDSRPAGRRTQREHGGTVVRTRGLTAGYGRGAVVHDLDLDVAAGEVVAMLGPNGAGKTTTLLALSGAVRDVHGDVEVLGRPVRPGRVEAVRAGAAHVLQSRRVFTELTARDHLRLVDRRGDGTREALALFPALRAVLDRPAGRLSGGEQQMLALARAIAVRPRLLVVDELSLGLAPPVVGDLLATVRRLADEQGTAVLLAEQHAALALGVADRAYVLAAGRVTLAGAAADLERDPDRLLGAYLGET